MINPTRFHAMRMLFWTGLTLLFMLGPVHAQPRPSAAAPAAPGMGEAGQTVLYIATERLSDITLGYRWLPTVAKLGYGTTTQPWHLWFGGAEVQALVYLPHLRGAKPSLHERSEVFQPQAGQIIGNRFQGKRWASGLAALASFDTDGNGVVEGDELQDLYVWFDLDGDGRVANRDDAMRPAGQHYLGFDLRAGARLRRGAAREGAVTPFAVMVPYGTRIHLLELQIPGSWASLDEAALSFYALKPSAPPLKPQTQHPLQGNWRWKITRPEQWTDATRPWGTEAAGRLMLWAEGGRVQGLVKTIGPHHDHINLPLEGQWRDGRAVWISVSPLGMTRSEVRLESFHGHPVLRGRSFSNRNGKVSEWTWEARRDGA